MQVLSGTSLPRLSARCPASTWEGDEIPIRAKVCKAHLLPQERYPDPSHADDMTPLDMLRDTRILIAVGMPRTEVLLVCIPVLI